MTAVILFSIPLLFPLKSLSQSFIPRTLADHLYISQIESVLDEYDNEDIVWFYDGDTLDGAIHSNDYIAIKNRPVFYGRVLSSKEEFLEYNNRALFTFDPQFNYQEIDFMVDMEEIAEDARERYLYFDNNEGDYQSRLTATESGWRIEKWPVGTTCTPENIVMMCTCAYGDLVIFVEGQLQVCGEHVRGNTTIACDNTITLIDDIVYDGVEVECYPEISQDSTHVLGLIANNDILIGNTDPNGKGNGRNTGDFNDHSNKHIVITAAMLALNGSFTIQNHNNGSGTPGFDGYCYCDPDGPNPGSTDLRGVIYLKGSLSQHRRNYVRRSNCNGTGYDKDYSYDTRLHENPPRYFDQMLLNVEDNGEDQLPQKHQLSALYPNPFNSTTRLELELGFKDKVNVEVFDILGREIMSMEKGWLAQGNHQLNLEFEGQQAGLYFIRVSCQSGYKEVKKAIFMK